MYYLPNIGNIYKGSDAVNKIMRGTEQVWPLVPTGETLYLECGCIYGNGSSDDIRIELPFYSSDGLKVRFSGRCLAYTDRYHIGGISKDRGDWDRYRFWFASSSTAAYRLGTRANTCSRSQFGASFTRNTDMDLTFTNGSIRNNLLGKTTTYTKATNVPDDLQMLLRISSLRVYALQAWETSGGTDQIIFDGIPVMRMNDMQPGLYDRVGGGFYTNTATTITACYVPQLTEEYTMEKVTSIEDIVIGDKYVLANNAKDKIGYLYMHNPISNPHWGDYKYSGLTMGDSGYSINGTAVLTAMATGVSEYNSSYVALNSYNDYAVSSERKYDDPQSFGEVITEIVYGWGPPWTSGYSYGFIFLEDGSLTDKIWEYQWKEDPSSPLHVYDEPWHFAFKVTEDYDPGQPYVVGGVFGDTLDKAYLYHITPVS